MIKQVHFQLWSINAAIISIVIFMRAVQLGSMTTYIQSLEIRFKTPHDDILIVKARLIIHGNFNDPQKTVMQLMEHCPTHYSSWFDTLFALRDILNEFRETRNTRNTFARASKLFSIIECLNCTLYESQLVCGN